jgi:hypothetical protein
MQNSVICWRRNISSGRFWSQNSNITNMSINTSKRFDPGLFALDMPDLIVKGQRTITRSDQAALGCSKFDFLKFRLERYFCATSSNMEGVAWGSSLASEAVTPQCGAALTPFGPVSQRSRQHNEDDKTSMTTLADPKSTQSLLNRSLQIRKHLSMASVLKAEDGAWHGLIESNGEFPPEKGRYHLYIGRRTLVQFEE